ncbi:FecR domain-containing protein [Aurantimonas sp. A2-1-M11]|uniref:FecR domain-containing protein n=1 Tax=Aurantimonas sp. A2-1-M11 TaxID=3113712 RepID=UPI002F9321BD
MTVSLFRQFVAACVLVLAICGSARAQQDGTCTSVTLRDPPRTAIRCPGGLIIEAEAAARLQILAPASGGPPHAIRLDGNAVLIELTTARPFQIMTPHAIASVRGTVYAVDVAAGTTAVFVAEGQVQVGRRSGPDAVVLGPGEGVDVSPGEALTVRLWPQERVARLFSRFGR